MWSFSRDAVAGAGIVACFVLVIAIQGGGYVSGEEADDSLYETTGSIGSINRTILSLSEQQRERIHRALMRFPDAVRTTTPAPVAAGKMPREQALEEMPAKLMEEIPRLHGHKFLKLSDRILLVETTSREVVATIPRYHLLP